MNFSEAGQLVRQARKRARLSQQQVAAERRMSRATLSRIENGVFQEIGIRRYAGLLQTLGLELMVRPRPTPPTLHELYAERQREEEEALQETDRILREEMVGRERSGHGST